MKTPCSDATEHTFQIVCRIYKAIQWILFRQLLLPKGYDSYVAFFYFLTGLILSSIAATAWVAVVLKGDNASNVWVKRLIGVLQTFAMVIYTIFWVAILDYGIFFFDCQWTDLAQGLPAYHIHFTDKSKHCASLARLHSHCCDLARQAAHPTSQISTDQQLMHIHLEEAKCT